NSPGSTTYTLTITNTGEGAAIPIAGYEIIDTLPPGMTIASCTINPPLIGTCTNAGNLVNIDLQPQSPAHTPPNTPAQPILAYLPSATSGLVNNGTISITATINAGLAD